MKRITGVVVATLALVLAVARPAPSAVVAAVPPPSPALLAALSAARDGAMPDLIAWATQQQPSQTTGPVATLEGAVMNLAPGDRDALLYWLGSHGRAALHAQGANDTQIGVPYYAIDYALTPAAWPATVTPLPAPPPIPTPTPAPAPPHRSFWSNLLAGSLPNVVAPIAQSSSSSTTTSADGSETTTESSSSSVSVGVNTGALLGSLIDAGTAQGSAQSPSSAWRQIPFGAATLSAAGSPSQIAVTQGIASVRYDGTQGFACVSFVNHAPQAVTEVDIDVLVIDGLGFLKRALALRRTGTFAPGAAVDGPASLRDVSSARPNCVIDGNGAIADPTDPFARAVAVGYAIRRVTYADGTSWIEPGANPWPAP